MRNRVDSVVGLSTAPSAVPGNRSGLLYTTRWWQHSCCCCCRLKAVAIAFSGSAYTLCLSISQRKCAIVRHPLNVKRSWNQASSSWCWTIQ